MEAIVKYAQNIQAEYSSGSINWNNLENLKNEAKTYANIKVLGQPVKRNPAPLKLTAFQFNLPANAKVRKVNIEYKHAKIYDTPNISGTYINNPGPTIHIIKGNSTLLKGKGQAPTKTATWRRTSWDVNWDASVVNGSSFGVWFDYTSNTNTKGNGTIILQYIRVVLDYVLPSYSVGSRISNDGAVYGGDKVYLALDCSEANLTGHSCNVTITSPSGLNFVESTGGGSFVQNQAHNFTWTSYNNSRVLVFTADITFPSNVTEIEKTFQISINGTSITRSQTVVIHKPLPKYNEETGEGEKQYYDDTTEEQPRYTVTVDEEFDYTFSLSEAKIEEILHTIYDYGIEQGWWTGTYEETRSTILNDTYPYWGTSTNMDYLSKNHLMQRNSYGSWTGRPYYSSWDGFIRDGRLKTLTLKGTDTGYDEIELIVEYINTFQSIVGLSTWKFDIRPQESSLTVANFSQLTPTEEECKRLGDGYTYTVQSDMQQVTEEEYTRDWYRNFRIGVFNNRIEANCTDYTVFETEETSQPRTLQIPVNDDLTDCTLDISVDKAIDITIDETTYQLTDNDTETLSDLTEYFIDATLTEVIEDTVHLSLTLKDPNNQTIGTHNYISKFEQEETKEPYSYTEDTTPDYETLTSEEIFTNAEYWSENTAGLNTSKSIDCEFPYNENYPLHILITGDYPEGDPTNNTIQFTEPCIIETSDYTKREPNGQFPETITDLIHDEGISQLTLEAFNQSNKIRIYDLPLDDEYGTNTQRAIRGIELTGNLENADEQIIYAKLKSPTGESRSRSIVLGDNIENTTEFIIGGAGDLWGFNTLDLVNLEDWEVEFNISNLLNESSSNISINDMQLAFYIEQVETQRIKCYIEDEDISYYGVFLTDLEIPEGLKTDTSYLSIDGTDTNDAYRQNIREKEIKFEAEIGNDCDMETNTLSLREFTKLLVNNRDEYNRPIPKTIRFSHYPDVYWQYIMETPLDTTLEIGSYHIKATLTIPAGTSYDLETTTTSNVGYVNGIANINPSVIIKPIGEVITVREEVTGQEFHIAYAGEWTDKIIEIDCENQIAWLKTNENDIDPINMNKYVDFNSDWFTLKGEFEFTGVNCTVQTVDFAERW